MSGDTTPRSYPIERLRELTGNIWWGSVISLALFTAGHIPLLRTDVRSLDSLYPGPVPHCALLWRRNLPVNAIVHALFDAVGLLLVPAFVQHGG